jgi:hypothetical protein
MRVSQVRESIVQGCMGVSQVRESIVQGCMGVSQVRESTNVRTIVKNVAFAGKEQTKYTQITPAMMFKVTAVRTACKFKNSF